MPFELRFTLTYISSEAPSFIDTLFTVLRTKSYLPYTQDSSTNNVSKPQHQSKDTGIPIPFDALLSPNSPNPERGIKRNIENDDWDRRPHAKGPRLSNDGQFSRY